MPTAIKIRTENSDFQTLETLRRNRVKRNRSGEFFVEGVRAITQAVANQWEINALVFSREKRLSDWAEGILQKANAKKHFELPLRLMEKLSDKEDASELIALVGMPADELSRIPLRENMLALVLDRPASPGNLGAIIRSCDALGVDGVIVTGHAADLYDPETIRATTGSFFSVPTVRLPSHKELIPWLDGLKQRFSGLRVVGTSAKAKIPIHEHDFTLPTLLLVGNETNGLSDAYQALADAMVTIPMFGSATSLNIACAASVLLYEATRQRGL
ncbi:MAG: tRNA/rRNA methyltransferase (SpoU) [Anaerolineaceae bacterium]|nr:MAG: tRNA/rRNA methyltransferase (SpoU) [Anaerolineaceae bacterium]